MITFTDDIERMGWFQVYAASLGNNQPERAAEADNAVIESRKRCSAPVSVYADDVSPDEWCVEPDAEVDELRSVRK